MKRIFQIILGVLIVIFLLARYSDETHPDQTVIAYLISNKILRLIIIISLLIIASSLIAGKNKDYSRFFYKLLVKIFGDPSKRKISKS